MVTVGWRAWKSFATFCQYSRNGPAWFELCHHCRVTAFLYRPPLDWLSLPPLLHPLATRAAVTTSAKTAPERRLILIWSPRGCRRLARAGAEFYSPETCCQSVSITFAKHGPRSSIIPCVEIPQRVKMSDVARTAGVSVATVSKVVN